MALKEHKRGTSFPGRKSRTVDRSEPAWPAPHRAGDGRNTFEDGFEFTAPVGSFPADIYGLHATRGNVWEWTSNWCQHHNTLKSVAAPPRTRVVYSARTIARPAL